jgi:hypothetical protein
MTTSQVDVRSLHKFLLHCASVVGLRLAEFGIYCHFDDGRDGERMHNKGYLLWIVVFYHYCLYLTRVIA